VVGVADKLKGQVAMAFAVVRGPQRWKPTSAQQAEGEVMKRWTASWAPWPAGARAVRHRAAQDAQRQAAAPRLQAVAEGRDPGDLTTMEDPGALQQVKELVRRAEVACTLAMPAMPCQPRALRPGLFCPGASPLPARGVRDVPAGVQGHGRETGGRWRPWRQRSALCVGKRAGHRSAGCRRTMPFSIAVAAQSCHRLPVHAPLQWLRRASARGSAGRRGWCFRRAACQPPWRWPAIAHAIAAAVPPAWGGQK
jgi:hypothetical protein